MRDDWLVVYSFCAFSIVDFAFFVCCEFFSKISNFSFFFLKLNRPNFLQGKIFRLGFHKEKYFENTRKILYSSYFAVILLSPTTL